MTTNNRDHAVVLGASVAGLLAARVLADRYARVTLVERDALPVESDYPQPAPARRGVPQAQHSHAILPRGLRIIEELLPGLTDDLRAAGGLLGDVCGNARWYLGGRRLAQRDAGAPAISTSRALLEAAMRARVRDLSNVSILDGYDIVGLNATADRHQVAGVRVTSSYGLGSRVLPADLVVDATGRGSRAPRWLAELGYDAPAADTVTINLSYRSRRFRCPPEIFGDDVVIITARFPGERRSSAMQRLEDGTVLVTLGGILGEQPPAELDGWRDYTRTLAAPDTYDVVRLGEPIGPPAAFAVPRYVRYRYERLDRVPDGLLVVGDALCSFNPIYGQGMTVAAINADLLREHLAATDRADPAGFYARLAPAIDAPWSLGVGADLALEGVVGTPLPPSPLTGEYLARLQCAAVEDAEVAAAFLRVTSLVDAPTSLLRPDVVARVNAASAATAGPLPSRPR